MPKLAQIIAIERGEATRSDRLVTDVYQLLQKPALLAGHSRIYRPRNDEDEERFPPDRALVQVKTEELNERVGATIRDYLDLVATKEWANVGAKADVIVNDKPLLKDVPVTYLLFLEKQLLRLHTYIQRLPVLDPSEVWHYDAAIGCWATEPVEAVKTKKVKKALTMAPATDKHPAQVTVYDEDVPQGTWVKTSFSGAMPSDRVRDLLERVEELQRAVKFARQQANSAEAPRKEVGQTIFDYVFQA